jgi:hypothetical protein
MMGKNFIDSLVYILFADAIVHALLYVGTLLLFFTLYYFLVCNQ